MIINPLFIKPENPGFMGETIKSKFSNSSYLFSDIIKIVGSQGDDQLQETAIQPGTAFSLSANSPVVVDKNNQSYEKLTPQALNNIVTSILKQNGISPSDDTSNFQLLINNINKFISKGKSFKINLTTNDKNINIKIDPETKDYFNPATTSSINSSLNINSTLLKDLKLSNPVSVSLSTGNIAETTLTDLTHKQNVEESNNDCVPDEVKNVDESLNAGKESTILTDLNQCNVLQTNSQVPELINTVYALNSSVMEPESTFTTNASKGGPSLSPKQENDIKLPPIGPQIVNKMVFDFQDPANNQKIYSSSDIEPVSSLVNNNDGNFVSKTETEKQVTITYPQETISTDIPLTLNSNGLDKAIKTEFPLNGTDDQQNGYMSLTPEHSDNSNQINPSIQLGGNIDYQKALQTDGNNIAVINPSKAEDDNQNINLPSEIISNIKYNSISEFPSGIVSLIDTDLTVKPTKGITLLVSSETKNSDVNIIPESVVPNISNSSGKTISDVDLNRIAISDFRLNNSDRVFNLSVEITDNSSNLKPVQLLQNNTVDQSSIQNNNISRDYFSDFSFYSDFEKMPGTKPFISHFENQTLSSGLVSNNNEIADSNISTRNWIGQNIEPLDTKISLLRKVKGQKLVVSDKTPNRIIRSQSIEDIDNLNHSEKQASLKQRPEGFSIKQEDDKNVGCSVDKNVVQSQDSNTKSESNDFSNQTVVENKSNASAERDENPDVVDSTKSKVIAINPDEATKNALLKNTSDGQPAKSMDSSIQNIVPVKVTGIIGKDNVKALVSASADSVQPEFLKVKAEDVVKEIHRVLTNDDSRKVILNMQPEDLGNVKIEFDIKEKSMNAKISVETESAKNLIQSNSETLKNSLHDSGITLNSLNVLLSDGSRHQHVPIIKKKIQKNEIIETHVEPVLAKSRNLGYNTYEYLA